MAASNQVTRPADAAWLLARLTTEFSNWSEYVADVPPVLMIRATPKLVENFWTMIGRGRPTRAYGCRRSRKSRPASGMRVFCGDAEVTPIHPFVLDQEVSDEETVAEGLYILPPGALPPTCGSVRLSISSQKDPGIDTRTVDPKVLQQIWNDFAAYRAQVR